MTLEVCTDGNTTHEAWNMTRRARDKTRGLEHDKRMYARIVSGLRAGQSLEHDTRGLHRPAHDTRGLEQDTRVLGHDTRGPNTTGRAKHKTRETREACNMTLEVCTDGHTTHEAWNMTREARNATPTRERHERPAT